MRAILIHDGKILLLTLKEITPPGWFSASVEAEVDENTAKTESQKMLALPAPEHKGSVTGRFSHEKPNADNAVRATIGKKQMVLSNLKSGIYRYLPNHPHDGHYLAKHAFGEYLRKNPLKKAVSFNQLWTKAFPEGCEHGAFSLAVAAMGHGKDWTISEGRSAHGKRRIFLIGPK